MKTKRQLTDEEFLAKFENDEIEWTDRWGFAPTAEIRAYFLLRREWDERILTVVTVRRRLGTTWAAIAAALGISEEQAIAQYRELIGKAAELAGRDAAPTDDTGGIQMYAKFRDHAASKLNEAIAQARAEGLPESLIERESTVDHYET